MSRIDALDSVMRMARSSNSAAPLVHLDKTLQCHFCGHDHFYQREGKIQTTGLTLLDLDWLNKSATCVVCERCGFVHWFLPAS